MRSELTRWHRLAALGMATGACLMVTACGASNGDSPDGHSPSATIPVAAQKFCGEVQTAMASLAGKNPSDSMKLSVARSTLDGLLNNGIKNFGAMESDAPASLKSSIVTIVADFKSYEKLADKAKTTRQLLASSVKANPAQKNAYQELLSYAGQTC